MLTRRYAFVPSGTKGKTRHLLGMPQSLGDHEAQVELPAATIVLLEETGEGCFLYRYSASGLFAGDTWDLTEDDAKEQADFEFGIKPSDWLAVPEWVVDARGFVIGLAEKGQG
ncbi:MAG TPA: hypothetical protein VEZ90_05120 [Blastocatellia bacterium]|nr:hypothetical protein [Blastocatellia bacterium]